jgi:GMP synthase-like glutamine amidotransferase
MNIGIIQCDQVEADLLPEYGTYPQMFARWLQPIAPEFTYSVYDVRRGEFPNHIDASDAYLITGSRHGVYNSFAWIRSLEGLIREMHESGKKIIGICFGHQLIAKALGGKVIKSPKGWGIGMSVNQIIQQKPWMAPSLELLKLRVSHQDQVVELPPEAEVLAESDFCPFYVLQIRDNLLTVQGHPEFSRAYAQALIETRKNKYGEELAQKALKSLQQNCDDTIFAQWVVNFLHR